MEDNWWSGIAAEMQSDPDSNNIKVFYTLMKTSFGRERATVTPLISKNCNELLSSESDISKRWKQHFLELLSKHSQVDLKILGILEHRFVVEAMNNSPSLEEVELYISKVNFC